MFLVKKNSFYLTKPFYKIVYFWGNEIISVVGISGNSEYSHVEIGTQVLLSELLYRLYKFSELVILCTFPSQIPDFLQIALLTHPGFLFLMVRKLLAFSSSPMTRNINQIPLFEFLDAKFIGFSNSA